MTKREEINQAPPRCAGRLSNAYGSWPCPKDGKPDNVLSGEHYCDGCYESHVDFFIAVTGKHP